MAVEMHSSASVSPSWPRAMPTLAMTATAPQARKPNTFVMPSSSRCSGDFVRLVAVTMSAMRPIWVAAPVAVTTKAAEPRVTWVFWNTMLVRSPSATSPAARWTGPWRRGRTRRSAPTPDLERRGGEEPPVGGDEVAGLDRHDVARHEVGGGDLHEVAVSADPGVGHLELGRASTLACALSSWFVPITTLNVTSAATTIPVATWPMARLATATMSSMMFIGFASWPRATTQTLGGGSLRSSLRPVALQTGGGLGRGRDRRADRPRWRRRRRSATGGGRRRASDLGRHGHRRPSSGTRVDGPVIAQRGAPPSSCSNGNRHLGGSACSQGADPGCRPASGTARHRPRLGATRCRTRGLRGCPPTRRGWSRRSPRRCSRCCVGAR